MVTLTTCDFSDLSVSDILNEVQVSLDDINSTYTVWSHFTTTAANSSNKVLHDPLVLRRNFPQITRQGGSNLKYCSQVEHMVPANDVKTPLELVTMVNIVVLYMYIFLYFIFEFTVLFILHNI